MHVVVREQRGLDEAATAQDLAHGPADLVFLSFSDTDLAELAAAWQRLTEPRPVLRLANLAALRHPMSVDLYIEQTIQFAQCVVVRLTGGIEYWRYGAEQVAQTCKRTNCALAFLPGSGRDDPRLAALSNTDDAARAQLDAYLFEGGANNALNALLLAARLAGLDAPAPAPPLATAPFGVHEFGKSAPTDAPLVVLVFYRSHLLASDIAPLERLAAALEGHGMRTRGLYVTSLKDADAATYVEITMRAWRPALIINATGFSARAGAADASPLDAADAPVLQVVLSGSSQEAWATSERGLSAVDLAMQVALPELDGRIIATAISFKTQDEEAPQLHFRRTNHRPANAQIKFAVAQILGLIRLRQTAPQARKLAIVLSDYPGIGGQVGHAIGLDTFASVDAILRLLHANGYDCRDTAVSGHLRAPLESGVITLGTYENPPSVGRGGGRFESQQWRVQFPCRALGQDHCRHTT
jgi:cobaltochelatase CobN